MLDVVAVEVLRFFSRKELDEMCVMSQRLGPLVTLACETHPFRRIHAVHLKAYAPDIDKGDGALVFDVSIEKVEGHLFAGQSFETLADALPYLAPFYRSSYVDEFEVQLDRNYRVSPQEWSALTRIFMSGAARYLWIHYVDLSILDNDAFVKCELLSDDVLRSFTANGVVDLQMISNKSEDEHTVSEDALLKFCFPPGVTSHAIELDNLTTTSDMFAAKFFKRLLDTSYTSVPRGFLVFTSKQEQNGLADYAKRSVRGQENPTYRFEEHLNGADAYHFVIDYRNREYRNTAYPTSHMDFSFGYMDLR